MTKTTNYNLNQWDAADRVTRADFNADNAAIDAALKAIATAAGNCAIYYTSYTGTGATTTMTITVPKGRPMLIFLGTPHQSSARLIAMRSSPAPIYNNFGDDNMGFVWGENSVSWCYSSSGGRNYNGNGGTYEAIVVSQITA